MKRLAICLLNVSEAKNVEIIENIVKAAVSHGNNHESDQQEMSEEIKSTVLNVFNDRDYNRTVVTIAAPIHHLGNSLYHACKRAYELIDLSGHSGGHPRLGAVDLIPVHPLSDDVTLDECGELARGLATRLAEDIPGTSFFLFGHADKSNPRGLVERRKEVGWFAGRHGFQHKELKYDIGAAPTARYGLTGIGAIPYMMNCNVTIDTEDLQLGRDIAMAIRGTSPGGLAGVQSMAFRHQGKIEIACNVQSYLLGEGQRSPGSASTATAAGVTNSSRHGGSCDKQEMGKSEENDYDQLLTFGRHSYVPGEAVEARIRDLAAGKDVDTEGMALLGFEPKTALELATEALTTGQKMFWMNRQNRTM